MLDPKYEKEAAEQNQQAGGPPGGGVEMHQYGGPPQGYGPPPGYNVGGFGGPPGGYGQPAPAFGYGPQPGFGGGYAPPGGYGGGWVSGPGAAPGGAPPAYDPNLSYNPGGGSGYGYGAPGNNPAFGMGAGAVEGTPAVDYTNVYGNYGAGASNYDPSNSYGSYAGPKQQVDDPPPARNDNANNANNAGNDANANANNIGENANPGGLEVRNGELVFPNAERRGGFKCRPGMDDMSCGLCTLGMAVAIAAAVVAILGATLITDSIYRYRDIAEADSLRYPINDFHVSTSTACPAGYFHLGPFTNVRYTKTDSDGDTVISNVPKAGWKKVRFCGRRHALYVPPLRRSFGRRDSSGNLVCPSGQRLCGSGGCFDNSAPCPITGLRFVRENWANTSSNLKFTHEGTQYTVVVSRNETGKRPINMLGLNGQYPLRFKGVCEGMITGSAFDLDCGRQDVRYSQVDSYAEFTDGLRQYFRDIGESASRGPFGSQAYLFTRAELEWNQDNCGVNRFEFGEAGNRLTGYDIDAGCCIIISGLLLVMLLTYYPLNSSDEYDSCASFYGLTTFIGVAAMIAYLALTIRVGMTQGTLDIVKASSGCTDTSTVSLTSSYISKVTETLLLNMFAFILFSFQPMIMLCYSCCHRCIED